jgi:hypothetical protein
VDAAPEKQEGAAETEEERERREQQARVPKRRTKSGHYPPQRIENEGNGETDKLKQ